MFAISTFCTAERQVNVIKDQVLGQGGFGVVYRVKDVSDVATTEFYALKDIACPQNFTAAIIGALHEVQLLNSLSHANIIKLMAANHDIEQGIHHVRILMEYCSGGNLNDRLALPSNDSMNLKWMCQIADALAYLHSRNVVHRDLKPENVLLTNPVTEDVKLADFGLARTFISLQVAGPVSEAQYYMQTDAGTRHYMAPEVFTGHYTEKADVFSMGILFYAIMERRGMPLSNGKIAYGAFVSTQLTGMVGLGKAMANAVAFTQTPPNIQRLILNLLSIDYHQRMNASDVSVLLLQFIHTANQQNFLSKLFNMLLLPFLETG